MTIVIRPPLREVLVSVMRHVKDQTPYFWRLDPVWTLAQLRQESATPEHLHELPPKLCGLPWEVAQLEYPARAELWADVDGCPHCVAVLLGAEPGS